MTKSDFHSLLYPIVARCHVSDLQADVLKYAQSRLKKGFWEKQSLEWQTAFAEACTELHEENIHMFALCTNGTL
jgi:hypothetical protein